VRNASVLHSRAEPKPRAVSSLPSLPGLRHPVEGRTDRPLAVVLCTGESKAGDRSPSTRSIPVFLPAPSTPKQVTMTRMAALPPRCGDLL
jgi:hypothetical protein